MKPITFSQVNSIEPLDASRFQVVFPTIQGVKGETLTLHHAEVGLPNKGVAQISVKYLGNTANFRGSSQNDSVMTVSFVEDADASVTKALFAWLKLCRNSKDGTSALKAVYAQPADVLLFDTKGNVAVRFKIYNMWPMLITMPQLSDASAPVKYEVQFSVDALEYYVEGEDNEGFDSSSFNSANSNYNSANRLPFTPGTGPNVGFSGGISGGIGGSIGGSIGLTNTGLGIGLGAKIGPFNLGLNANIPLPVNALTISQFTNSFANTMGSKVSSVVSKAFGGFF